MLCKGLSFGGLVWRWQRVQFEGLKLVASNFPLQHALPIFPSKLLLLLLLLLLFLLHLHLLLLLHLLVLRTFLIPIMSNWQWPT